MAERVRYLNPEVIDAAEHARASGWTMIAAGLAQEELQLHEIPFSTRELALISVNPRQRLVLAGLARIYADSTISQANASFSPPEILSQLVDVTTAINTIYRNPDIKRALKDETQDYKGREHYFSAEMERDISKLAQAAAVLFHNQVPLMRYAKEKLLGEAMRLPQGHPTKNLMWIEWALLRLQESESVSQGEIQKKFAELVKTDLDKNPHRVATIASKLIVVSKKNQYDSLHDQADETFKDLALRYPDWNGMVRKEKRKLMFAGVRRAWVQTFSAISTTTYARHKLETSIIKINGV